MAKRVSLQGKGVELFFGGTPRAGSASQTSPQSGEEPAASDPRGARTRARVQARPPVAVDEEELLRALQEKQRLASSTFRFQPEELEQLDEIFDELNRARPRRISKNDLVRLGLRWLLSDYAANRERSLAGKLLQRS